MASILDRLRRDLDVVTPEQLNRLSLLVHSDYGAGKTHFLGDALLHEKNAGGAVAYINMKGEDSDLTLAGMGLGSVAYTVGSTAELKELLTALAAQKLKAVGLDSLKLLAGLAMEEITGGGMPDKEHYRPLHWKFPRLISMFKSVADYAIAVCPSDKSVEQLTGRTRITPDLPGRQVTEVGGYFDFVGFLQTDIVGPGKIKRSLVLTPNNAILTRQRRLKLIPDIDVPAGGGGWAAFKAAIQKSMEKETTK